MAYCSVDEIKNIIPEDELINLTVDNPDDEYTVNIDRFEDISKYADEMINGYLRSKYTLPLQLVPDLIKKIASDLAAYRLYMRRPKDIPEHIKENFKMSIKTLGDIQKGYIILDLPNEHPDSQIEKPKSSFITNKSSHSKIFDNNFFNKFGGDK